MAVAWCVVAVASATDGPPVTVTGAGNALGLGPAARSLAIADAQAAIVLDRIERLAPSRDFSIFTPLLRDAPTFFQSFKVLKESKTDDSTQVEIEGQLLDRKLKQELAAVALAQNFVTPRIVVLAHEELAGGAPADLAAPGIIESKLHKDLKRIQFEFVPPAAVRAKIAPERWAQCVDGNPEQAAMLARDMLADVVVLGAGTARAEEANGAGTLQRVRAEVALRVVRAEDGYTIDAPKAEAVVNCVDPHEGSAQAIEDACGKLIDDAKTAVALGALGGAPADALFVTIEGLAARTALDDAVAAMKRCIGAGKHEILFQDGVCARVRIEFAGAVGDLIDCLPSIATPSGRLAVKSVVDRDVALVVEKR